MGIFEAIIFGVVQGLAEFLPISSSGHLAVLGILFGLGEQTIVTAVLLHVATFFSVVFVFRKQIWALLKNPFSPLARKLYLASFFSFVIAFALKGTVETMFEDISFLPLFFIITAVILFVSELYSNKLIVGRNLGYRQAAVVGIVQGLAVLPGISRSGSTISAALFCGVEREEAAEFSFLLSLPIILASALWEGLKLIGNAEMQSFNVATNLVAFVVAFVVGIFAVVLMKKLIKKAKMWWFSIYLIVLSILIIIFL